MIIVSESLVSLGQGSISSFGRQALQLMGPLYATPAQRPTSTPTGIQTHNQSAFTQQWVRSPSQRTGRIVSQRHLRAVVTKYVRYYNSRHPHRACDLRPPQSTHPVADLTHERIKRRPILSGLIRLIPANRQPDHCCRPGLVSGFRRVRSGPAAVGPGAGRRGVG